MSHPMPAPLPTTFDPHLVDAAAGSETSGPAGTPPTPGTPHPAGAVVPGVAVAALLLGAVAAAVSVVPFVNIGALVAGTVALALGVLARHRIADGGAGRRVATAGAVLGAFAATVAALVLFAIGAIYTTPVGSGPAWQDPVGPVVVDVG